MKTPEYFPRGISFEEVVVVAASCPDESSVYPQLGGATGLGRRGQSPNLQAIAAADKYFHHLSGSIFFCF